MSTWTESTRHLPLWWGGYRSRYLAGLVTIVIGIAATNLTSTYSLWFLAVGPAIQGIGWLLLPAAPWRRLLVLLPCLLAGIALLAGASFAGSFAVLLAGWLLVRHRPALSYLTVLFPTAASFPLKAFAHEYGQNWIVLSVGTVVVVASAWLARWIALRLQKARLIPSESEYILR
jgi:hypothetical protein